MAPRFEASGFASSFRCKFRLKALDDGKLRCYFHTETSIQEVAARFRGLSQKQFDALVSAIEKFQGGENRCMNTAVSHSACEHVFDCCIEQAVGRKPQRMPDSRRSLSPPSPSSKPPAKRSSVRLSRLHQNADLPRDQASKPLTSNVVQHMNGCEYAGAQQLSFRHHVVWLQCNDDRCMCSCSNTQTAW